MKGIFAILLIACGLMFPGNIATGSSLGSTSNFYNSTCIYCQLTPPEIIEKAAGETSIPFCRAWYDYCNGVNTITPLPSGWSVSLRNASGGFVIIDIIDDL